MAINFNQYPYFDDFDTNKHFHKILFKPGVAVQGRELTQSQTILQDQLQKFGNHIFQNHSVVSGAQTTINFNSFFIKLEATNINNRDVVAEDFVGKTVKSLDGNVIAKVLVAKDKILSTDGEILYPPLLILSYLSGTQFTYGDIIYTNDSEITARVISATSLFLPVSGSSSVVTISNGVMYIDGYFVGIEEQTISIDDYSNVPTAKVGISIEESIVGYDIDSSLLDPALGESNYQAPGADRYKIYLRLVSKPIEDNSDTDFIETLRINSGIVQKAVLNTAYSIIDDYFARRTFDTNGDFVVNRFKITAQANTSSPNTAFQIKVGPGKAYVRGYIAENQSDIFLNCSKSKDYNSVTGKPIFLNYGNYVYTTNHVGQLDFKNYIPVDIHVVSSANTANTQAYATTKVATAKIKNLEYVSGMGANTQTYVYKTYLFDIQSNIVNETSNNLTDVNTNTFILPDIFSNLPSSNSCYVGASLLINSGNNAGDLVTVSNYDATTRKITTSRNFITTVEKNVDFSLIFNEKHYKSFNATSNTQIKAVTHYSSKTNGVDTGDTFISDKDLSPLIYELGNDYIKEQSLLNGDYFSWVVQRGISLDGGTINLSNNMSFIGTGDLPTDSKNENFIAFISDNTDANIANGSIFTFDSLVDGNRNINISEDGATATFTCEASNNSAKIDVFAKIHVENPNATIVLKAKKIVSPNTSSNSVPSSVIKSNTYSDAVQGKLYFTNTAISFNTTSQSLYVSDVINISKIIDSMNANLRITTAMLTDLAYDVTRFYSFDTGQKDTYYDHSSIQLIPNSPPPKGDLLIFYKRFDHAAGDGYFSVDSYLAPKSTNPIKYQYIPSYKSSSGKIYNLRDCLDFRPARVNETTDFRFSSINHNPELTIPVDGTLFTTDYGYYLARKDIVIVSKDKTISLIEGIPSLNPKEPVEPDGSIVIAKITHEPYDAFIPGEVITSERSSINIENVEHKRWRMEDITTLENRVSRVEYYTSLNTLEQATQNLQITDEYGLNRFKNGIVVDNFTSTLVGDVASTEFFSSIDPVKKRLYPVHTVQNFKLELRDVYYCFGQLDDNAKAALNYNIEKDGSQYYITLKYNQVTAISQPYASRTIGFIEFCDTEGICELSPPMDNWVSTEILPNLLIVDPNIQLYEQSNTFNVLSTGNWQTISSTKVGEVTDTTVETSTSTTTTATYRPRFFTLFDVIFDILEDWELVDFCRRNNMIEECFKAPYDREGTKDENGHYVCGILWPFHPLYRLFILTRCKKKKEQVTTTTTITTTTSDLNKVVEQKTDVSGYWTSLGSNFVNQNGYITDVSINPYIRAQQIQFKATGLLKNTPVKCYFDGVDVTDRILVDNELIFETNSTPDFRSGEIWGYVNDSSETVPFAEITEWSNTSYTFYSNTYTSNTNTQTVYVKRCHFHWFPWIFFGIGLLFAPVLATAAGLLYLNAARQAKCVGIHRRSGTILSIDEANNCFTIPREYEGHEHHILHLPWFHCWHFFRPHYTHKCIRTGVSANLVSNTITIYCNNSVVTSNTIGEVPLYTTKPVQDDDFEGLGYLSTDDRGSVSGIFYLPEDTFTTGEKIFRIDNRIKGAPDSETTFAQASFFASSLNIQKQYLEFAPDISHARNVLTSTNTRESVIVSNTVTTVTNTSSTSATTTYKRGRWWWFWNKRDPLSQTFILFEDEFPYGAFLKSVKICFRTKPMDINEPITLAIVGTQNGYPDGNFLQHSVVTLYPTDIKISETPHMQNPETYTEFVFPVPVYVKPETMYAFMLKTNSNEYTLYVAKIGDMTIESTVQEYNSTTSTYREPFKITITPYVGDLFLSQNAQTWEADIHQDFMFEITRCDFDITQQTAAQFILPKGLPQRKLVNEDIEYITQDSIYNANNELSAYSNVTDINYEVNALNVTTTDLTFDNAGIEYSFKATILDGLTKDISETSIIPGRYGTATMEDFALDDGKRERVFVANPDALAANSSFSLYAKLRSNDPTISPIISDVGVTVYGINYAINNLEINQKDIVILDGGAGYSSPVVSITSDVADDANGEFGRGALGTANVVDGEIVSINLISTGSGYCNGAIITVSGESPDREASIIVATETSNYGGNGLCRYVTKPIVLNTDFDAGDLRVYFTAYRPVGTNIYIYYKIINRNDTTSFNEKNWKLMTLINGNRTFSTKKGEVFEYIAAPGINGIADNKVSYNDDSGTIYVDFNKFAIKVVCTTDDKTKIPYLTDIRGIALPEAI